MGVHRVFESLLAEFVTSKMIPFAVRGRGGGVGMLCQIVKFRGSIVGTLGHRVLLLVRCAQAE